METGITAINEKVKQESVFVNRKDEIEKVIVGQKYLIERLLVGILAIRNAMKRDFKFP